MTILGLPLHPLVVHAAVVLVPLAALGTLLVALSARARKRYGSLVALGSVVAFGAVIAARVTGEDFAGTTTGSGALATHMYWGLLAPWPTAALAVTSILLALAGRGSNRRLILVTGILAVVAALASLAVVVLVGHSGATAVWGQQT